MAKRSRETAGTRARRKPAPRKAARRRDNAQARAVEAALAALAHEIRTPLTGILALAELLSASELGPRERGWAASIKSAAEHLAQLTTIVCDAVRADAVGLTLRREMFSPRRLGEAIAASLSARAATSGLAADISIAGDLPQEVIGDRVRLRAAVENLIDNAVKFTARGGVKFELSAQPVSRDRVKLVFAVTDSGIGLTPQEIRRLFRPFSQASEAVSRRYGGAGLGLALVKRIAKAMGGDLAVTSAPGKGSTFRLTAVAQRMDEAERKAPNQAAKPEAATGRSILCVEDNAYGRVVLNTILSELGHRATFVASGEAALDALGRGSYDLVLMDVMLGGIDGLETARRLRALAQGGAIPIVGISARSAAQDKAAALAAGMNAYLVKPVSPAALAETIAAIAKPVRRV
jgi:CheY-like chemotaxis protein